MNRLLLLLSITLSVILPINCSAMDDLFSDVTGEEACSDCSANSSGDGDGDADTTAPIPGGGLVISNLATTSLDLNWVVASDDITDASELEYLVVQSTADNISTESNAQIFGVDGRTMVQDWTANFTTISVSGLADDTNYYFNVLVRDSAQNEAAYTTVEDTTDAVLIYMFGSDDQYDGDLEAAGLGTGGREGADNICAGDKAAQCPDCSCSTTLALISVSGSDQIADFDTLYSLPTDQRFVGPTGIEVAADFIDLLDGSITTDLDDAGVLDTLQWWAGSGSDGTISGINHCTGWTDVAGSGQIGDSSMASANWLDDGFGVACSSATQKIVCLCYEPE